MHYMYKITNTLNSKVYIGQSITPEKRWKQHQAYSNQEKPVQYVHSAMVKYGIENFEFEIIAACKTQEDADETEIALIQRFDSRNKEKGYNIKPGGSVWDDEARENMSEKMKRHYINHPEDRVRVSEQAKNQWQDPEYAAKMKSISHPNKMKGFSIPEEQRLAILEGVKHLKGIPKSPMPDDIKKKVSDTKKNFSQEKKEEIANSITVSRGQVVLSKEQKQSIVNDPSSSYILAEKYGVNASTIQRIRSKAK